jgi:hypothetical protein
MYKSHYYPYSRNNKITENSKVIIGIGDSFCAGHGSCSIELWEKYDWDLKRMGNNEVWNENYQNSWVNQLCKTHMNDWTPVNLGMAGKGNRYAIKELMVNPRLGLEKAKEKIVVFVTSGFERFDLAKDLVGDQHFTTQWPIYNEEKKVGYSELTYEDGSSINCEKFVLSEFILNMIELINWCKLHNSKLLLISAFTPELNEAHFYQVLSESVKCYTTRINLEELLKIIPWNSIIRPLGFSCITDMIMHLEGWDDQMPNYGFRDIKLETMGPNGYMTKCHHLTEKGQKLLSEIIYDNILNYDEKISKVKKIKMI